MVKKLLTLQTLLLAAGTIFSWSRVVVQFQTFIQRYGTIFRIKDCAFPNPFVTACFYGSVAFIVALVWSGVILQSQTPNPKSERYLRNFLLFCIFFALSVLTFEFLTYYKVFRTSAPIVSCSPGVFPLYTPCFIGMLFFLASYLVARYITKQNPQISAISK
jgi:hypothetical protein